MSFRRRSLSQNLFRDPKLVAHLVGLAKIGPKDTVVDIGAGRGIITAELAKVSGRVIAVEVDPEMAVELKREFAVCPNVEVYLVDIRRFALPQGDYKVFANVPFHITSDIVYQLLYYSSPPVAAYLVLAKEAAEKFAGVPRETQFSVLAKPWFEFKILRELRPSDFSPEPEVAVVLLEIVKRGVSLVSLPEEALYKGLIKFAFGTWRKDLKAGLGRIFTYNQWKRLAEDNGFEVHAKPTDLTFSQWLAIFKFLEQGVDSVKYQRLIV